MCTRLQSYLHKLIKNFTNFLTTNEIDTVVLGVSGGIDSALSLAILSNLPIKISIKAYFLDIESTNHDKQDIFILQKQYPMIEVVDLKTIYDSYQTMMQNQFTNPIVYDNLKTRIRNNYLYAVANEYQGIVISSLNFDEYHLGFFTKNGDNNADYHLLIGLLKTQIYKLAAYFQLPKSIIDKKPSPGFNDLSDYDILGFNYQDYERNLLGYKTANTKHLLKIKEQIKKNTHKHFTINRYVFTKEVQTIYDQWFKPTNK
ncbi:NAD(+) synthase [Ureaplasma sp. ES3154-GEN]|uniref:NAD(+) synthase n=1 Tax=Ureaplasma sp. ES3154-GEN TaxID=2984844 RepID=UPI0021E70C29|nr:NAD(+) synthase [Ureaplasma sp. ES3154-GEN]MCV3743344.1 NAD(+) synthase [Ureaplasma sp. ES3154-GEN]